MTRGLFILLCLWVLLQVSPLAALEYRVREVVDQTSYLADGDTRVWADFYDYDALYRVTGAKYQATEGIETAFGSVTAPGSEQVYTLDLLENRTALAQDGATTAYSHNAINQITAFGPQGGSAEALTYDDNGNLTSNLDGSTLTWNAENRLETVEDELGELIAAYVYDHEGRRLAKVLAGGAVTYYYYDGWDVYRETDGAGATRREYLPGLGLDQPVAIIEDDEARYYQRDALGSVVALTDDSGSVVERYEYDIYGNATVHSADGTYWNGLSGVTQSDQPYYFTSRRYDPESGLYYYRNRYYSAELGVFLSHDPLDYVDGMNLYAYVSGNPVNFIDPMGLRDSPTAAQQKAHAAVHARWEANGGWMQVPAGAWSGTSRGLIDLTIFTKDIGRYTPGGYISSKLNPYEEDFSNALDEVAEEWKADITVTVTDVMNVNPEARAFKGFQTGGEITSPGLPLVDELFKVFKLGKLGKAIDSRSHATMFSEVKSVANQQVFPPLTKPLDAESVYRGLSGRISNNPAQLASVASLAAYFEDKSSYNRYKESFYSELDNRFSSTKEKWINDYGHFFDHLDSAFKERSHAGFLQEIIYANKKAEGYA